MSKHPITDYCDYDQTGVIGQMFRVRMFRVCFSLPDVLMKEPRDLRELRRSSLTAAASPFTTNQRIKVASNQTHDESFISRGHGALTLCVIRVAGCSQPVSSPGQPMGAAVNTVRVQRVGASGFLSNCTILSTGLHNVGFYYSFYTAAPTLSKHLFCFVHVELGKLKKKKYINI